MNTARSRATHRPIMNRLSDGALAVVTAASLTGITAIGLYAFSFWKAALALIAVAAFGAVEMFDRSTTGPRWLSRTLRLGTAMIGGLAAFALLFFVLDFVLRELKP
jgi:hypothetical protein